MSTVPAVQGDNLPAVPDGMEDFDESQQVIPALKLNHDDGKIVDGLSGQEYDSLEVICLGLIKQRVLWPPEPGEGEDMPMCKSFNFKIGNPDYDEFPWKASGFTKPAEEVQMQLPCESCALKDWESHPNRKDIPWCSEQHTYAVLQPLGTDPSTGEEIWAPALFTIQRSALKTSNAYLTSFHRAKEPMYVCKTKITLDLRKRGTVDFVVPKFARGAATEQAMWPTYSGQYRMIREFVQTPRNRSDDDEVVATETTPTPEPAPAPAPAPQPAPQPAPAPAPAPQPAPEPAPAPAPQPAPAPAPAPEPAPAPAPQPTPEPAPAPAPAPAPEAQPEPVAVGAPAPAAYDDDDLPF